MIQESSQHYRIAPALPGDVDGRDLAAVAVALREEELSARRVPADQVAVTAARDQQAVLHHEPAMGCQNQDLMT